MSDLIHVKGLADLQKMLDTLPAKLEKNVLRGALRVGAKVVMEQAKLNVPVKSGALRDGLKIGTTSKGGRVTATIKSKGKHGFLARWMEFGVAAHQITAKKGGWLFFGGNFAKSVDHPGFAPRPFLRPALDSQATAAVVAVGEYVKKRLTKEGLDVADISVEGDE